MTPDNDDRVLIRQWSDQLVSLVKGLLTDHPDIALVDFPHHGNVGDSAIWLGEVELLKRLGVRIVYACDLRRYEPRKLRRRIGDGPILIHGGGNLGDLWPRHQRFRERVVEDFPSNRVIQLPQSIHFGDEATVYQARSVFEAHSDFHLIARDRSSLEFANQHFDLPTYLAPDSAFSLGPLFRHPPTSDIVVHSRADIEAPPEAGPVRWLDGLRPRDWLEDDPTLAFGLDRVLLRAFGDRPRIGRVLLGWYPPHWLQNHFARIRLSRGVRFLSEGRVVITNRLHGHILCGLLGIKHFLSDNSYGKLRACFDTWTHGLSTAIWCESQEEALQRALEEVGRRPEGQEGP